MGDYKLCDFYVVKDYLDIKVLKKMFFENKKIDELMVKWVNIEPFNIDFPNIMKFIEYYNIRFNIDSDNMSVTIYPSQYTI